MKFLIGERIFVGGIPGACTVVASRNNFYYDVEFMDGGRKVNKEVAEHIFILENLFSSQIKKAGIAPSLL